MLSRVTSLFLALLVCVLLTESKALAQLPTVTFTTTNPLCHGAHTGSVQTAVSGGVAPYAYGWNTGATTANLSNLVAGTYTVTVTATNNVSITESVVVTEPAAIVTYVGCTPVCAGACDGAANLTVVGGGTPPYTYHWSTGATSEDVANLCTGVYWVTIADAHGCMKIVAAEVIVLPTVAINGNVTNPSCDAPCSGSVLLNVSGGGSATYTYQWDDGTTAKNRYNLCNGVYTVTATSANGCTGTASFTVNGSSGVACFVSGDDSIPASSSSEFCATAGASYAWSNGATTQCITVSTAGVYSVTVTTANGCSSVCSRTLTVETNASCLITGNDAVCSGASSQFCAPAAGSYAWSTGATSQCVTLSNGGTYSVTVTYAGGTTAACSRTLTISTPPSCQISGPETIDAGATVQLCGNAGMSSYHWSNGATTQCIGVGNAGTYSLTVTNAGGCSAACSHNVIASGGTGGSLSCSIASALSDGDYSGGIPTNIYFGYGPHSATLNANVTGGNGSYTYAWTGSYLSCSTCPGPTFTPTAPGTYTISVTASAIGQGSTTCSITFCVQDVIDPDNSNKVLLCHVPPGNPANAHTISISANAVPAHLANHPGDHLGPCGQSCQPERADVEIIAGVGHDAIEIYPNPFSATSTIEFTLTNDDGATLELFTATGVKVATLFKGNVEANRTNTVNFDGTSLADGVYLYRLVTSTDTYTGTVIRLK